MTTVSNARPRDSLWLRYLSVLALVVSAAVFVPWGLDAVQDESGPPDGPREGTVVVHSPVGVGLGVLDVAWVGEWLVFEDDPTDRLSGSGGGNRLWKVRPDGSDRGSADTGDRFDCSERRVLFGIPVRMGGDSVGFVQRCGSNLAVQFRVLNLVTGAMSTDSVLVDAAQLLRLTGMAVDPIEGWILTVREPLKEGVAVRQSLQPGFRHPSDWAPAGWVMDEISLPMELVWGMAASPDGQSIAFFGREDVGMEGSINTARGALYVSDTHLANARPIGLELSSARVAAWSPDGRWLLAAGASKSLGRGLFVVEVATGITHRIAKGWYTPSPSAWSPDGTHVAVTQHTGDFEESRPSWIRVIDVTPFIGPNSDQ